MPGPRRAAVLRRASPRGRAPTPASRRRRRSPRRSRKGTPLCFDGVDDNCSGTADEDCPVEHCGTISSDETWDATTDHIVTCTTYVQGGSRPVLTIADGATVYFDSGASLWVGWGRSIRLLEDDLE